METSLRLGGESKSLRIHAKEKFPIGSNFLFQAHGEIDTSIGAPNYFAMVMRRYFPGLSAYVGSGVHFDKEKEFGYIYRGKKSFQLSPNGPVGINIKGLLLTDKEYRVKKKLGAVELSWSIFDFRKDQDVRLKVGYEILEKMPYFQVRENNWTVNAFLDGKWNNSDPVGSAHLVNGPVPSGDSYESDIFLEETSNLIAIKSSFDKVVAT